eukprot:8490377-Pyramimonas_sp.AAC.1
MMHKRKFEPSLWFGKDFPECLRKATPSRTSPWYESRFWSSKLLRTSLNRFMGGRAADRDNKYA